MSVDKVFWWGNEVIRYHMLLPTKTTGAPFLFSIKDSIVTQTSHGRSKHKIERLLKAGYTEINTKTAQTLDLVITCADGSN